MDADGLALAAEFMPIFPLIGGFMSLIGGAVTWALESVVSPLLAGGLGLGVILLLNGIQHVDGLLDFGDGMMCHGSRSRKLSVMRDPQTGAGGFALGLVVLSSTIFAIADLNRALVIQALIVGEAAAKFSMVVQAWMGKAARKGLSSIFVAGMHSRTGHFKIILSTFFVLLITVPLLGAIGLLVIFAVMAVACVVLIIANNAFGGLTGDVMGATNEMARLVSLMVILVGAKWV
jgi:adenosylcobinamide-GDP ribazoletransferase